VEEIANVDTVGIVKKINKLKKTLEDIKYTSITDEDRKLSAVIEREQGINHSKWAALNTRLKTLGVSTGTMTLPKVSDAISAIQSKIDTLVGSKPCNLLSSGLYKSHKREINEWNAEQNQDWLNDPDGLYELREKATERLLEADKVLSSVGDSVKKPDGSVAADIDISAEECTYENVLCIRKKRDALRKEWSEAMKNKCVPSKNKKDYGKWKKEYDIWCAKVDSVAGDEDESLAEMETRLAQTVAYVQNMEKKQKEKNELQKELTDMEKELAQMNSLPFNPDCWACQKQPMRIRHTHVSNNKKHVETLLAKTIKYLKKLDDDVDGDSESGVGKLNAMKDDIAELQTLIDVKRFYDNTKDSRLKEVEEWAVAESEWKLEEEWKAKVGDLEVCMADLEKKETAIEWALWKEWKRKWKLAKADRYASISTIEAIDRFLLEYKKYEDMAKLLDEENDIIKKLELVNASIDDLTKQKDELMAEKEKLEVVAEMTKIQNDISMCMDKFANIKEFDALTAELGLLSRAAMYKSCDELCTKIECKEKELVELRNVVKYTELQKKYEEIRDELCDKRNLLILLDSKFVGGSSRGGGADGEGYKEWVYREHVVPIMEMHVNRFLALIDNISLSINYANKSFQYTVLDRGNTPSLGMTSGYQRFIISLALRIAFAKIGATGQNLGHLFIDEGFVACDAVNLDKVHVVLKGMMEYGGYRSIMLMSHLDTIRNAADIVIDIERVGLFSYIRQQKYMNMASDSANASDSASASDSTSAVTHVPEVPKKKTRGPSKKKVLVAA
jgi:flagellar biosynthesis/type III secretory pathway chaperone